MGVAVVMPYGAADGPERVRAREWVANRYESLHGLPVTFAECPTAEWSKGAAVNPVADTMDAEILVIADADSYVSDEALTFAIGQARANGWAMPHRRVKRICQAHTERILNGRDVLRPRLQRSHQATVGGGILVVTQEAWRTVRGFDPRFIDWGGEDAAIGLSLAYLVGLADKGPGVLWHLWHPPAAQWQRPLPESVALMNRYRHARDPASMADLVREW